LCFREKAEKMKENSNKYEKGNLQNGQENGVKKARSRAYSAQ